MRKIFLICDKKETAEVMEDLYDFGLATNNFMSCISGITKAIFYLAQILKPTAMEILRRRLINTVHM